MTMISFEAESRPDGTDDGETVAENAETPIPIDETEFDHELEDEDFLDGDAEPAGPSPLLPVVAIVGRPNVGKSTLFNRILQRRHAIVDDRPGVTRDRLYALADWAGHEFTLVDTGGLVPDSPLEMERLVNFQVEQAIATADVLLLVTDARVTPSGVDEVVARKLLATGLPVCLAVNKADHDQLALEAHAFWSLGVGEPHAISATHRRGVGDLLDRVIEALPEIPRSGRGFPPGVPAVAIIGRPNVGKSSLLNQLAGEDAAIVSDVPGTTRDATDSILTLDGKRYGFIDTAGLRRRGRIERGVEHFSALRTLHAIQRAEVAMVLIDSEAGVTAQDVRVAAMAAAAGRGVVIVANKWDLADHDPKFAKAFEEELRRRLHFIGFAPLERVSALTGRRVSKLAATIDRVHAQYYRQIPTAELNRAVEKATRRNPPPAVKGKHVRVLYATQTGVAPQRFVYFMNTRLTLPESYQRFLNNRLRAEFGFEGVPLSLRLRYRPKRWVES